MSRPPRFFALVSLFLLTYLSSGPFMPQPCVAQSIEPPNRRYLFIEDQMRRDREAKRAQKKRIRKEKAKVTDSKLPFDIDAPSIRYDSTRNSVLADGGLVVSRGATTIEADQGEFKVDSREGVLRGNVWISDPVGSIAAEEADLNLDTITGKLSDTEIYFTEGGYQVEAASAEKLAGEVYRFEDASLSTCECPEGDSCLPWRFEADKAEITREGYGIIKGATLSAYDVPVLYTPYLIFPAKTKRQTGFLPATIGRGRQNGFDLQLPFFWAISESSDALITGIYESKTRKGMALELRSIFSVDSNVEMGGTYLDESSRDGALLGTDITGLHDPEIDENRFAGFIDQSWRGEIGELPLQMIIDGNYVSDDLFLREFENEKIAPYNARFVTSRALLRSSFFGLYSAELASEYNQALVTDDDLVFQRLPELSISGIHRFKPFGDNPFGAKLVLSNNFEGINFRRREGFDGSRYELREDLKLPFHYRNYFDGLVRIGARGTMYSLQDRTIPQTDPEAEDILLDKRTDRIVPNVSVRLSNVLEKVVDVDEGVLKSLTELGSFGRRRELVRIKHTLQPELEYLYVPFVGQEDNPQFDADDRLAERSVITYGLTQRLFGRFDSRNPYLYGIEEATPEVADLGSLRARGPLEDEFGLGFLSQSPSDYVGLRKAAIRELASLSLSQSFDLIEDRKDNDPERGPVSDLAADLTLLPNDYVRMRASTDFDVEDRNFSSYGLSTQLMDKRGDQLRARLTFTEDRVRQLETSIEVRMTERLKLGYYTRYDDLNAEFIENKFGVRLTSACNCWMLDGVASEKTNPDETRFLFTVTLIGVGELSNTLLANSREKES